VQYRRVVLAALLFALPGCSARYRTRLDCIDICKEHGLRFVEVTEAVKSVNPRTGETKPWRGCTCE